MSVATNVPVLGVDTGVWLTSRVDDSGIRRFYVGASTKSQRLNFPSDGLEFVDDILGVLRITLDTQMVSGLSIEDSEARRLDHVYAMSRCSVNSTISTPDVWSGQLPLHCVSNRVVETSTVGVLAHLEVETIFDLLVRWNEHASESEVTLAKQLRLSHGDQIMIVDGDSTAILVLGERCDNGAVESTVYCIGDALTFDPKELLMPTLKGTARIGSLERV